MFQEVKILEYADRAEIGGILEERHHGMGATKRATLPSCLSSGGGDGGGDGGGGGRAVPKASLALENLNITITIRCARPAATG